MRFYTRYRWLAADIFSGLFSSLFSLCSQREGFDNNDSVVLFAKRDIAAGLSLDTFPCHLICSSHRRGVDHLICGGNSALWRPRGSVEFSLSVCVPLLSLPAETVRSNEMKNKRSIKSKNEFIWSQFFTNVFVEKRHLRERKREREREREISTHTDIFSSFITSVHLAIERVGVALLFFPQFLYSAIDGSRQHHCVVNHMRTDVIESDEQRERERREMEREK